MKRKQAFTLIELLVVIVIIAILAAILFPVFSSAREKARQSACLSNTKQLSLAFQQYVNDYDETFPAAFAFYGYPGRGWVSEVYPYFKSVGVLICPSDPYGGTTTGWSYAYNQALAGWYNAPYATKTWDVATNAYVTLSNDVGNPITMSQFTSPGRTVAASEITEPKYAHTASPVDSDYRSAADCGIGWRSSLVTGQQDEATGYLLGDTAASSSYDVLGPRHSGGSCFVMADGHAKWFTPKMVAGGKPAVSQSTTYCEADGSGGNPASGTECTSPSLGATFSWY